jgi:NADH-quinone oxidoreductase subunit F
MMANPHVLIEGIIIACYAIRASHAFIYVRGEVLHVHPAAAGRGGARPTRPGYLGRTSSAAASTSTWSCTPARAPTSAARRPRCSTRSRATAASRATGRRSRPSRASTRARPCVNNVESIASVPSIIGNGKRLVPPGSAARSPTGFGIFSLSGHVTRSRGSTRRRSASRCASCSSSRAACSAGHPLKFWTPGGSSTPLFTDEHLDVPLDFEGWPRPDRCSAPGRCRSSTTPPAWCAPRCAGPSSTQHESCGKCTPCREGTYWLVQDLPAARGGQGTRADIEKLLDICDNIMAAPSAPSATVPVPDHLLDQVLPRRVPSSTRRKAAVRSTRPHHGVGGVTGAMTTVTTTNDGRGSSGSARGTSTAHRRHQVVPKGTWSSGPPR